MGVSGFGGNGGGDPSSCQESRPLEVRVSSFANKPARFPKDMGMMPVCSTLGCIQGSHAWPGSARDLGSQEL